MPHDWSPLASSFARVALDNICREYPNKLDHVINGPDDVGTPRALHPLFFGSFDWHSCVHMHWLLIRLLRLSAELPEKADIHATLDAHFTPAHVAAELAYLQQPSRQSFERTYGWAWLLKLQTELILLAQSEQSSPAAIRWRDTLQPLADAFVLHYLAFLPIAQFPIRAGTHANSAFGLLFALEYAQVAQHPALRKLVIEKAHAWYGRDRAYPAQYEPSGDDFLSGGLLEAALMMRCIDGCSYADWWHMFCPDAQHLQTWLLPVPVTDRCDPKLSHLDGLNLSRAWCWRMLQSALPVELHEPVQRSICMHLDAALPHTVSGDYVGTHWLASFALLALTHADDSATHS
jgi:hypothetical protein